MNRERFTKVSWMACLTIMITAIVVAITCFTSQQELCVIDEAQILEVYTPYGTFRGVAVAPHLILTVAHGANVSGKITVNHYPVQKIWSDEDADMALLRTDETFYTYSNIAADYPLTQVKGYDLKPGDSGTAVVNTNGVVCFLLQGYDHTAGQYVYMPVTRETIDAIRLTLD